MNIKDERVKEGIKKAAAEFVERESNKTSLITVTGIQMRNRGNDAYVLVTVLPEQQSNAVVDFLNRKKKDMRSFLSKRISLRVLPFFHFEIDHGEKNRQRIDEIGYTEEREGRPFKESGGVEEKSVL